MNKAESIEKWTRRNLMQCERLSSLIQPSFCAKYRDNNPYCKGCTQFEAMDAAAKTRPVAEPLPIIREDQGAFEEVPQQKEEAVARKRIEGTCRCCGKEGTIHGRGLIVQCYFQHKREGTLEKFPMLGKAPFQKKQEGAKEEPQEKTPEPAEAIPAVQERPEEITLPAPANRPQAAKEPVCLEDLFQEERDRQIFERIRAIAHQERRTVEAQILVLLEDMLSEIGDAA